MKYVSRGMAVLFCVFFAFWGLAGCGSGPAGDASDTAIQVNDVTISTQEFNDMIKLQAYSDPEMDISRESRREYVDYLIRKELMIQEAIRLKMDRKKEFIKTIETYWESTLIRRLLDYKTAELKKKVLITEDEMEAYYVRHKDEFGQPYDQVKPGIKSILESKFLERELEAWTKNLRAGAKISVDPSLSGNGK